MWIWLPIAQALKSLNLSKIPEMSIIKSNCQPNLQFSNINSELLTVVAVFRHGDRAPLKIKNEFWPKKECVSCENGCIVQNCEDGMITSKGFEQSKKLGAFIKDSYLSRFKNLREIKAYRTTLPRSYTTLRGVFIGMQMNEIPSRIEKSLVHSSVSNSIKNFFLNELKATTEDNTSLDYNKFDELVTSYCSKTPISCTNQNCDSFDLLNIYNDHISAFENVMKLAKESIITSGMNLGDLGVFLKGEIKNENTLSLLSSHDSTIIKVLQGLNIPVDAIPPYSSVVFIEVWKDSNNQKFVRVVYEGDTRKFGLYKEKYVDLQNFIDYLDMFNIPNSKVKNLHSNNRDVLDHKTNIENLATITKDVYKPIINEIKKDPELRKQSAFKTLLTHSVEKLKSGFSFLNSALAVGKQIRKNYLFGWFTGKKEEMITIKQNIETDEGDIVIHTIECPKSGKGNCKTVSKQKVDKKEEIYVKDRPTDQPKKKEPKLVNSEKPCTSCADKAPCASTKPPVETSSCPVKKSTPCEEKKANLEPKIPCSGTKLEDKLFESPKKSPCEKPIVEDCASNKPIKVDCPISKPIESTCPDKPKASPPCPLKVTPNDCPNKPLQSAFKGLSGSETTFKTQGCNIISRKTVPTSFFGPTPPSCPIAPLQPPQNPMPCYKDQFSPQPTDEFYDPGLSFFK